ncbi:MAG: superoxide dismutase [Deltaproteobacteria bacterium]|nr:superoxide dismutase [Deltaproteobacteria bacterium]
MAYQLPNLPYDFGALEPHLDAKTMEIHHGKHHATYVAKLNAALEKFPALQQKSVEQLLREFETAPTEVKTAVRNHGGGHANHSLFWQIMSQNGGGTPTGQLAGALQTTFGDVSAFQAKFTEAATNVFGSGWAWLVVTPNKTLELCIRPNQDSPLMEQKTPILGLDVWEHAYYLKYQNRRPDYVTAWWNTVNWTKVGELYDACVK